MIASELQAELRNRHLQVLAVGSARVGQELVAIVYLHGNAGEYLGGYAMRVVRSVPGVKRVAESGWARTIILAWLDQG